MDQKNQPSPPPSSPKAKSNLTLIIVIVIIAILLFLGAGGYFLWKYYLKGKLLSSANPTTTTSANKNSPFTLTQLEEMIKYPNGTLTSTDHSKASGYTSVLEMETDDSMVTANNYYLGLNSNQKWVVAAKSLESDNSRADITYTGTKDKFTIYFVIDHNYEKTAIYVRIDAEDLPVGTPLGTNSVTPSLTATPASATSSPNSNATNTTKTTISSDYVITDSNTRVVSDAELTSLTPWQLKVARNEIYARYGRPFVHKDLGCYFATKSWYQLDNNFTESMLSTIDSKNIATIQAYEQKVNSPLQNNDSGC